MSQDRHDCLWSRRGCNSGTIEDAQPAPAKTEKPDTICDGCRKTLERAVTELPETWLQLSVAIGDRSIRPSQKVSGTKNPPIPMNVDVDAARDQIIEWAVVGGSRIAAFLNLDDDPEPKSRINTEHARVVQQCATLLTTNLDRLLDAEEETVTVWRQTGESVTFKDMTGIDVAFEIMSAQRRGWRILHAGERQSHACPLCYSKSVYRIVRWTSGGKTRDIVECQDCGKTWEYDAYQTICRVALKAIEEEQMEEELEQLRQQAREMDVLREKIRVSEWLLREAEWKFALLLDPSIAGLPVEVFAREVLGHGEAA